MPSTQSQDLNFNVEQSCSQPVQLKIGQSLTVNMQENASTGYMWSVVGQPKLVKVTAQYLKAKKTAVPLMGVPHQKVIRFTAMEKGSERLKVQHARSWEHQAIATWQCNIVVS